MGDPMDELQIKDLDPKNRRLSFISLTNRTEFYVSLSIANIDSIQKDLADPHKRWLVIGDEEEGTVRWIAIQHIAEIKWVPNGT